MLVRLKPVARSVEMLNLLNLVLVETCCSLNLLNLLLVETCCSLNLLLVEICCSLNLLLVAELRKFPTSLLILLTVAQSVSSSRRSTHAHEQEPSALLHGDARKARSASTNIVSARTLADGRWRMESRCRPRDVSCLCHTFAERSTAC